MPLNVWTSPELGDPEGTIYFLNRNRRAQTQHKMGISCFYSPTSHQIWNLRQRTRGWGSQGAAWRQQRELSAWKEEIENEMNKQGGTATRIQPVPPSPPPNQVWDKKHKEELGHLSLGHKTSPTGKTQRMNQINVPNTAGSNNFPFIMGGPLRSWD